MNLPSNKGFNFILSNSHNLKPEYFGITRYKWNKETGLLDVDQDVFLNTGSLGFIPFEFGNINGDFIIVNKNYTTISSNHKDLISLKGSPRKVYGDFDCSQQSLVNLEYSPEKVTGSYDCRSNKLESLKGCTQIIHKKFRCDNNPLKNLEGGPKRCTNYHFHDYQIKYLYDYPVCVIDNELRFTVSSHSYTNGADKNSLQDKFYEINTLIRSNKESFYGLLDDKVNFHQQIMRMKPEFIPSYKDSGIPLPSKKSIL